MLKQIISLYFELVALCVMAGFTIKINDTFQDKCINVLDDELNNLKNINDNKKDIDVVLEIVTQLIWNPLWLKGLSSDNLSRHI